jgi:hypothetical protein
MKTVYNVKFARIVKYAGSKESEYDPPELSYNVLAQNAEAAIAKVRKQFVGERREWEDDSESPPIKHQGEVVDIVVQGVQHLASIDL